MSTVYAISVPPCEEPLLLAGNRNRSSSFRLLRIVKQQLDLVDDLPRLIALLQHSNSMQKFKSVILELVSLTCVEDSGSVYAGVPQFMKQVSSIHHWQIKIYNQAG